MVRHVVELSQGEFKSVEEYVEFVLSEVVKEEGGLEQVYTSQEKASKPRVPLVLLQSMRYKTSRLNFVFQCHN